MEENMATFDDRKSIDQFIKNDGWLDSCMDDQGAPDNPPVIRIVEYQNAWGKTAFGVVFKGERDPYRYEQPSEYVNSPRVIWKRT